MKEYEVLIGEIEAGKGFIAQAKMKQQETGTQLNVLAKIPEEEKELTVELRDPNTMESFPARVIFFSDYANHPEMNRVYFVEQATRRKMTEQPWAVKIIEEIEEPEKEVEVLPVRKLSLGERRGTLLKTLLEQKEKKGKE